MKRCSLIITFNDSNKWQRKRLLLLWHTSSCVTVHTQKHDGKYEEAGPQAHIQHSKNDPRQNAASTDWCKEQQQPSERCDGEKAAQTALAIKNTTPAVLSSGVAQAAAALSNWRWSCPWRPTKSIEWGCCYVSSRLRSVRKSCIWRKGAHLVRKTVFRHKRWLSRNSSNSSNSLCLRIIGGGAGKTGTMWDVAGALSGRKWRPVFGNIHNSRLRSVDRPWPARSRRGSP